MTYRGVRTLAAAYWSIRKDAAVGVDGVTKDQYGQDLDLPRAENWPVMSTDWKTIHIMPHNFSVQNLALTIRPGN